MGRVAVDPIVRHSQAAPTGAELATDDVRVFVGLAAGVTVEYEPVRQVRLRLMLAPEFAVTRSDYLPQPGADVPLVSPHLARLLLQFGVDLQLLER